ncbi:MAG: hypothetical protein ACI9DS_003075, partial [Glaciecola sp.]
MHICGHQHFLWLRFLSINTKGHHMDFSHNAKTQDYL